MSESTPIRKVRHIVPEPHAGRYAVFDFLPQGRRRCRLCGARVRTGQPAWNHYYRHINPVDGNVVGEEHAANIIRFNLRARRSRRNRREGQYQHATGGEPWNRGGAKGGTER